MNGSEKASRIEDRIIRKLDRERLQAEREPDINGVRNIGICWGQLFDGRYNSGRGSKWVYTPNQEKGQIA